MSALPPKADIRPRDPDVCFGPEPDILPRRHTNISYQKHQLDDTVFSRRERVWSKWYLSMK
jgi:hypothetical protein